MHCLDCRAQEASRKAVGVCRECGAGVSENHARVTVRTVRGGSTLSAPYEPPARTVRCFTRAAGSVARAR
ncbi:DUF2180 family protein [Streptomyces sp. MB09-02B]|uniref:DUF2180 family protein n=1 Tax=Streptomyces sp. MB09-02B TaxID=3028667 RepID=UPI0039AEBFF8